MYESEVPNWRKEADYLVQYEFVTRLQLDRSDVKSRNQEPQRTHMDHDDL